MELSRLFKISAADNSAHKKDIFLTPYKAQKPIFITTKHFLFAAPKCSFVRLSCAPLTVCALALRNLRITFLHQCLFVSGKIRNKIKTVRIMPHSEKIFPRILFVFCDFHRGDKYFKLFYAEQKLAVCRNGPIFRTAYRLCLVYRGTENIHCGNYLIFYVERFFRDISY